MKKFVIDKKNKRIKTTIDPQLAFREEPLLMLQALREAASNDVEIEAKTLEAMHENAALLKQVSSQEITAEFRELLLLPKPSLGLDLLKKSGISQVIFPELDEMGGVEQRQEYLHKDVFYHTLKVVDNISEHTDRFELRMVALMHDIAKPQTKRFVEGIGWTFHGHEELGARMVERIGRRMKLPKPSVAYISKLVRLHMRPSQLVDEEVTDSAIRRLMFESAGDIGDLMMMCRADITSKNPRKVARYLKNFDWVEKRIEEVAEKDRVRNFKPAISGEEIMAQLDMPPGPIIGKIKQAITDAIMTGEIPNEKDACLQYFLQIKGRFLAEDK